VFLVDFDMFHSSRHPRRHAQTCLLWPPGRRRSDPARHLKAVLAAVPRK